MARVISVRIDDDDNGRGVVVVDESMLRDVIERRAAEKRGAPIPLSQTLADLDFLLSYFAIVP